MVTKRQLQNYRALTREIRMLEDELQDIYSKATSATSRLSAAPSHSGGHSDLSTPVAKMVELETIIERKRDSLVQEREILEAGLDVLDAREREVIRLRYFNGLSWPQIIVRQGISESNAHNIHGRALKKLFRN